MTTSTRIERDSLVLNDNTGQMKQMLESELPRATASGIRWSNVLQAFEADVG